MNVCIANTEDKKRWDSFVDSNYGSFFHYFNWKEIFEINGWDFIPLMIENEKSEILAILPLWIINKNFCNTIKSLPEGSSGGIVYKKELPEEKKKEILHSFIHFIDETYSKTCGRFILKENLMTPDIISADPSTILIEHGFHNQFNNTTTVPCTFILKLKQPFETAIWQEMWGRKIRQNIKRVQKRGVKVKEDIHFECQDVFLEMMHDLYIRLGSTPRSDEEIIKRLTTFDKKTRLFVAFLDEKPISALLCYYTPSTVYFSKMPHTEIARKYQVNLLLFYEVIKDACQKGYASVEFGVTFHEYQARWKGHFKGTRLPIRQYQKTYSKCRCSLDKILEAVSRSFHNRSYRGSNKKRHTKKYSK